MRVILKIITPLHLNQRPARNRTVAIHRELDNIPPITKRLSNLINNTPRTHRCIIVLINLINPVLPVVGLQQLIIHYLLTSIRPPPDPPESPSPAANPIGTPYEE